jgi:hypothetical protein
MRAVVHGEAFNEEVIGEEFEIPGCAETFIVHRTIGSSPLSERWTATHIASGFAIGCADSPDAAIAVGRKRWLSLPSEQVADALAVAYAIRDARIAKRG